MLRLSCIKPERHTYLILRFLATPKNERIMIRAEPQKDLYIPFQELHTPVQIS